MSMKTMGEVIKHKKAVGTCPECGRTLYKGLFPDRSTRVILCECRLKQYEQEALEKIQSGKSKIEYNLKNCGFSKRDYQDLKKSYKTSQGNIEAYNITVDYASKFSKDTATGFYIYGAPGVGKSLLAKKIMLTVINKGYSAYITTITKLMDDMKADFSEYRRDTLNKCNEVDLLVIDDLGTEKPSDFDKSRIFSIINERYENMKPIIFTSNCELQDLVKKYDDFGRVHSRIVGSTEILKIHDVDHRKQ